MLSAFNLRFPSSWQTNEYVESRVKGSSMKNHEFRTTPNQGAAREELPQRSGGTSPVDWSSKQAAARDRVRKLQTVVLDTWTYFLSP